MANGFAGIKPYRHRDADADTHADAAYEASIAAQGCAKFGNFPGAYTDVLPGLTAFHCSTPAALLHVKRALRYSLDHRDSRFGLLFPYVNSVKSLESLNARQAAILQQQQKENSSISQIAWIAHVIGKTPISVGSYEGLCAIKPHLDRSSQVVIFQQRLLPTDVKPEMGEMFSRINAEAKANNVSALMLLSSPDKATSDMIASAVEDSVFVDECEPDEGGGFKFSVDYPSLHEEFDVWIVKRMCSIIVENGVISYRYEQFLAKDLLTRIMWHMKRLDKTVREIGAELGIGYSTVSKRLKGLDDKAESWWTSEYLDRQIEHYLCSTDKPDGNRTVFVD